MPDEDDSGPTKRRKEIAGLDMAETGYGRSKRVYMLDDELGKAYRRKYINSEEYSALGKYALHWLAGGLQGYLGGVDLNRIRASNPQARSGLAHSERQAWHRQVYWLAHDGIGTRPALVADHIACYGTPLADVAELLGYRSRYRGREQVKIILADAGYRLARIWKDLER